VDPAARREGTASVLLESLLRRLKRNGIGRLRLMVKVTNWRAQRFYRKYGFAKIRLVRRYYEDGRDGWQMEKYLP
jgi:ribosomal-protein-alanine N-acetyltransferase